MTQLVADPSLLRRIEALANQTQKSQKEIIDDALRGYLDWHDEFVGRVERGIDAANRGEFATPEEVERVFNKFRPA